MDPVNTSNKKSERLLSLDVFRGLSIAGMILVNNQGDWGQVYGALRHASWHGWSGADIVFPFFLFAVGASLFFALTSRLRAGASKFGILHKVVLRSLVLFALGLFLNLFPDFEIAHVRIPGVLQRIALCYLFVSILFLFASNSLRIVLTILLLVSYGALLLLVSPSGAGGAGLDPCCNLPGFLDGFILSGHTYEAALTQGFDPEGLLSTIPALCSTMIGVFAAGLMETGARGFSYPARSIAFGAGLMLAGLVLSLVIPINKNLWTPSYCLFMGGMAGLLFFLLHWLYDARALRFLSVPFEALGRNAIVVYFLSSLAGKAMIWATVGTGGEAISVKGLLVRQLSVSWLDPRAASLAYSIIFLLIWFGIAHLLYRKKIFIAV